MQKRLIAIVSLAGTCWLAYFALVYATETFGEWFGEHIGILLTIRFALMLLYAGSIGILSWLTDFKGFAKVFLLATIFCLIPQLAVFAYALQQPVEFESPDAVLLVVQIYFTVPVMFLVLLMHLLPIMKQKSAE